jgi:hypothetical protein
MSHGFRVRLLTGLVLVVSIAGGLSPSSAAHAQWRRSGGGWHGGGAWRGGGLGTWRGGGIGHGYGPRHWGGGHHHHWGWGGFGIGLGLAAPLYLSPPVYYAPPPYPYDPYAYSPYGPPVGSSYGSPTGYAAICYYAPPYECPAVLGWPVGAFCSCSTLHGLVEGRVVQSTG